MRAAIVVLALGLGVLAAMPAGQAQSGAPLDRMRSCTAEAGERGLRGGARRDYMSACIAGDAAPAQRVAAAAPAEVAAPAAAEAPAAPARRTQRTRPTPPVTEAATPPPEDATAPAAPQAQPRQRNRQPAPAASAEPAETAATPATPQAQPRQRNRQPAPAASAEAQPAADAAAPPTRAQQQQACEAEAGPRARNRANRGGAATACISRRSGLASMVAVATYRTEGQAREACGDDLAWGISETRQYHLPGSRGFASAPRGAYVCLIAAELAGYTGAR